MIVPLHVDHVRSYEVGLPSTILHKLTKNRFVSIIGCNLSCFKSDILKINGYNEDLTGVGGEDGDLQWRFQGLGIQIKSIKFLATVYHMHHESKRYNYDINIAITNNNKLKKEYICPNGINKL